MNTWLIVVWLTTGQFFSVHLEEPMTGGDCMKEARRLLAPHIDKVSMFGCVVNSGKET